jgi:hypothetical protein
MTTITIIGKKKTMRRKKDGNKAEGEDVEEYTPWMPTRSKLLEMKP